jgi:hypothetical protein
MYWPTEEVTAVESMLTSYAQQRLGEVSRSSTCVIRRASTRKFVPGWSASHYHGVPLTLGRSPS